MEHILEILIPGLFIGLPVAALLFFLIALIRFLVLRKKNGKAPDPSQSEALVRRKRLFIVSLVVFLVTEGLFLTFVIVMMKAIAMM